jgi:hypothetical protein
MRPPRLVLASLFVAACGAHADRPVAPDGDQEAGGKTVPSEAAKCTPMGSPSISAEAQPLRAAGLQALDRGDTLEARRAFEKVLARHPGNIAAAALRAGAQDALTRVQQDASRALEQVRLVEFPQPPVSYSLGVPVAVPRLPAPHLVLESRNPNKVIDTEAWYKRNAVALPVIANDALPAFLPTSLRGERISMAIDHGDHKVLVFGGRFVAVLDKKGAVVKVLDLTNFMRAGGHGQQLKWGQAHAGVLFVMHANPFYANESGGANAFISAIDLTNDRLAWRSQPLVGNAQNFLILGSHLITGYGFTAEPDFLYVLELSTGAVAERVSLATSPEVLIAQRDKLLVRGYDADFVFSIKNAPTETAGDALGRAPRSGLTLSAAGVALPEPSENDACLRDNALALLDRSDAEGALRALFELGRDYRQHPAAIALVEGARGAATGLLALQRDPVILARPPFEATVRAPRAVPNAGAAPQLVQRSAEKHVIDQNEWMKRHGQGYPLMLQVVPADDGKLMPPASIPPRYGVEPLRTILDHGDHLALIYGARYLVIVREGQAVGAYDFAAYLDPPRISDDTQAQFAQQDLTWAEMRDGVVYTAHGGGSYAREVYGKKGFVTALDAKSGQLLWRSNALVANANFILLGGYLITGYGFTDEPDFLYVLDRKDGKTVSRNPLTSGPSILVKQGEQLFVRGYDSDYVFDLRPRP